MSVILAYSLYTLEPLQDNGKDYPQAAYIVGWCISALGLVQLPGFAIYAICKQKGDSLREVRI
jgi:solute carrier family 6 amino acid transporter-like protein 5/7/9/14